MKRLAFTVLLSGAVAFSAALAQEKTPAPEKTNAPEKPQADPTQTPSAPAEQKTPDKAPDPGRAALVGEALAPGTVSRKNLFPLEDGRKWTYELKLWFGSSTEAEQDKPAEPPRTYRVDVAVGTAIKIDGRDARCLEYKQNGELAQVAYFFADDPGGSIVCPRRVLGVGEHRKTFDLAPPQMTLAADLGVGATWKWEGKTGATNGTQSFEVKREERLKVKAHTYDTVLVLASYKGTDDSTSVSAKWFAPDVGIVREETEVVGDKETYRVKAVLVDSK